MHSILRNSLKTAARGVAVNSVCCPVLFLSDVRRSSRPAVRNREALKERERENSDKMQ